MFQRCKHRQVTSHLGMESYRLDKCHNLHRMDQVTQCANKKRSPVGTDLSNQELANQSLVISYFRKILLFFDKALVHLIDLKLFNITVVFFPSNTTSIVQLLDQRIIRAFKAYYRSRLVKRIISRCEVVSTPNQVLITPLDAVHWIAAAWNEVTQPTIINTFRKAVFQHSHWSDSVADIENETTDDESIKKLDSFLSHFKTNHHQLSAADYAMLDDEVPEFNEWDDNRASAVIIQDAEQDPEEDDGHDHDDEVAREEPPSFIDALGMIRKLQLLVSVREPEFHSLISDLESKLIDSCIELKTSKQSSITDFFPRI